MSGVPCHCLIFIRRLSNHRGAINPMKPDATGSGTTTRYPPTGPPRPISVFVCKSTKKSPASKSLICNAVNAALPSNEPWTAPEPLDDELNVRDRINGPSSSAGGLF